MKNDFKVTKQVNKWNLCPCGVYIDDVWVAHGDEEDCDQLIDELNDSLSKREYLKTLMNN